MTLQYVRPDADSVDGGWLNESGNNTNLFASIDETVASDSDFIKSAAGVDTAKIRLSDPSATMTTPAVIRFRVKKEGGDLTYLTARLLEGSTVRATFEYGPVPDSFTTIEMALTTAEINSIVDTTNLFVELASGTQSHLGGSVDLNFQAASYYSDRISIAATDVLSISRASIGYAKTSSGTLTQFATDTLRITDLGLLIEDAQTNLRTYSQDIAGAGWNRTNATATTDVTAAPDGTTTADVLTASATNAAHFISGSLGAAGSTATYTWSIYFKAAGYNYAIWSATDLALNNVFSICVDLVNQVVSDNRVRGGSPTGTSFGAEALANGWTRAWLTMNMTAGNSIDATAYVYNAATFPSNENFLGDGVNGIYVWGAQVELGAFVSSYIPSTTTSATRAEDSVKLIGQAATLWGSASGTALLQVFGSPASTTISPGFFAETNELIFISGALNTVAVISNSNVASSNASRRPNMDKFAYGWATPNMSASLDGGSIWTAADEIGHSSSNVSLGGGTGGGSKLFGYVQRLTMWSSRLADATLQALTAP